MRSYIKRKDRIILTAAEIIDELGLQGLSTKEICKRQEFSEGSLYKHFKSKDEIILGVLDYYIQYDEAINETIGLKKYSPKESIQYYVSRYAEYYENYPAMTAILNSYEILRNESGISSKIKEIYEYRQAFINQLVEKGIREGEFKPETNGEILSDIILGTCTEITQKWRMRQYDFSLKDKLLTMISMILRAF